MSENSSFKHITTSAPQHPEAWQRRRSQATRTLATCVLISWLGALPAAAQNADQSPKAAATAAITEPQALAVVAEAIAAMKKTAMNRDKVNWTQAQHEAESRIKSGVPVQAVLEWLTSLLQDGHSRALSPEQARAMAGERANASNARSASGMPPPLTPFGRLIPLVDRSSAGYLRVPYLITLDSTAMDRFTQTLVDLQKSFIERGATSWVIDLRGNVGGNQWPMLAALSGVLGDGMHGSMTLPNGRNQSWGTKPGAAWAQQPDQVTYGDDAFRAPDTSTWRVAVLTDQRTASSAEAIAISFRGRPNTRSFGDATRGRSSANSMHSLSNGAVLALTVSVMMDRAGRSYGGPVVPDEVFSLPTPARDAPLPSETGSADPVLERALNWLATPRVAAR